MSGEAARNLGERQLRNPKVPCGFTARFNALELVTAKLHRLDQSERAQGPIYVKITNKT